MKPRWTIIAGVLALAVLAAFLVARMNGREKAALLATQAVLRQQGFKIALTEFDFSAPPELIARAAAITNAGPSRRMPGSQQLNPELMSKVGSDSAVVIWQLDDLTAHNFTQVPWPALRATSEAEGAGLWPALRTTLDGERTELDAACAAAQSGPIRFNLNANAGAAMLLPHLAALRNVGQTLGARALVELHDAHRAAAWTNLFAATRLLTAWDTEPVEIPQLVRFSYVAIAYDIAWQVLQARGWSDDQLAGLQHEWETVDFFKQLPETVAFNRASMVALCQMSRTNPLGSGPALPQLFREPRAAWGNFTYYWQQMSYRKHGSYDDENGLLLFYRDQEVETRRAIQSATWAEMRLLPAVTNRPFYQSKYPRAGARWQSMMNQRQIALAVRGNGLGLLSQAVEAEARRRLAITALALERYRNQHGSYPTNLASLAPEFLKKPPIDFMDGQLLRYRLTADDHFVLYSVGLDCTDDGGKMAPSNARRIGAPFVGRGPRPGFGIASGTDLVWPRPASATEIAGQKNEEKRQAALEQAAEEERQSAARQEAEVQRKQTVDRLLADAGAWKTAPSSSTAGPIFKGRPLGELLQNKTASGSNQLDLLQLLTLNQIITGGEPDTITFELPVSYDSATSVGRIHLVVDGGLDAASAGEEGEHQTCQRATNGNCLLGWDTTYDPPGMHAIQPEFIGTTDQYREADGRTLKVQGPPVPYLSTNICQFDSANSYFNESGAILYARLAESNGNYTINIKSPSGELVRTLKGSTTNGIVKVHWDLKDEQGRRYTNNSFDSTFDITLPDSGKSQHMK